MILLAKKTQFLACVSLLIIAFSFFAPTSAQAQPAQQQTQQPQSQSLWHRLSPIGLGMMPPPPPSNGYKCLNLDKGGLDACLTDIVYFVAVEIPTFFAYITTTFFSIAVFLSLNGTAYALSFLTLGWTIARDIANLAFLFILIYLAFVIMFKAETSHTLQTLAMVILVALIVNFSFFTTRVVIDAGNLLGAQIYNAIPVPSGSKLDWIGGKDLTASIMNTLNVQSLLDSENFEKWNRAMQTSGAFSFSRLVTLSSIFIIMGIMLVTLGLTFLAAGIKFLYRIVILWICIVLSPFAWVSLAIPGQKDNFKRWWSELWRHSIYPAAFLFIYLILVLFMKALGEKNGNLLGNFFNQASQNVNPNQDFLYNFGITVVPIIIVLTLIVLLLQYALSFADKLGVRGAHVADKAVGWLKDNITNPYFTFGPRWAGSKLYQQGVAGMANRVDRGLARTSFGHTVLGDLARRNVVQPVAKSHAGPALSHTEWVKTEEHRVEGREAHERGTMFDEHRELQENYEKAQVSKKRFEELSFLKRQSSVGYGTGFAPEMQREYESLQKLMDKAKNEEGRRTQLEAEIKKAGKREFETMSPNQIKNIVHLLSEKQLGEIKGIDSRILSETYKKELENMWNTHGTVGKPLQGEYGSPDNALNKFEKISSELLDISKKLGVSVNLQRTAGDTMKKILERSRDNLDSERRVKEVELQKARDEHRQERQDLKNDRERLKRDQNSLQEKERLLEERRIKLGESRLNPNMSPGDVARLEREAEQVERDVRTTRDRIASLGETISEREQKVSRLEQQEVEKRTTVDNYRKVIEKLDKVEQARENIPFHKDHMGTEYSAGDIKLQAEYGPKPAFKPQPPPSMPAPPPQPSSPPHNYPWGDPLKGFVPTHEWQTVPEGVEVEHLRAEGLEVIYENGRIKARKRGQS